MWKLNDKKLPDRLVKRSARGHFRYLRRRAIIDHPVFTLTMAGLTLLSLALLFF